MKIAESEGVYQLAVEELQVRFKAEAVMLIVINGSEGTSFAATMPDDMKLLIPSLFHSIAENVSEALATEHIAMVCPACKTSLALDPRHPLNPKNHPRQGSITVCAYCASFLTLGERWRLLAEEEVAELSDEVRIQLNRTRRAIEERRDALS